MQVQTPQNQLTPLLQVNYDQIYNQLLARLTPRQMIFAKWRAGFGGIIQWDLPSGLQWRRLSEADSYDYSAVMSLLENVSSEAKQSLGTNRKMIDAVYSVPSLDYIYYSHDTNGEYKLMLTGWGYRFPNNPAVDPLTYTPRQKQQVEILFRADDAPVGSLPVQLIRHSGHVGLNADENGILDLGTQDIDARFDFNIPSYGRSFSITVEKGRQQYVVDLSIHQPALPTVSPAAQPAEPEPINVEIDNIHVKFYGNDGQPVENATARFIQNNREVAAVGLLDGGEAVIEASALEAGDVEIRLSSPTETFPIFTMDYNPAEHDYEIYFHKKTRHNPWPIIIAAAIALLATTVAIASLVDLSGIF